jgi:vacuolar-type H+-ATPase subunit E/Vma4
MGVEPNDVIIRVNPRDRKLIELLLSRIGIRGVIVEDRLMSGGVIVMSGNGDISVDNSYETRLEACLRELLPKIFKG